MTPETITLYAVRNREGKWFRAKGYGGYGETWTAEIGKAKLYSKIGQARGRVTFFATTWPQHGTPEIVVFTATATSVLAETERMAKVGNKKAQAQAAREVRQREADIQRATRDKQDAEARLARLKGDAK